MVRYAVVSVLCLISVSVFGEHFRLPVVRNVALRALGPLRIVNARGAIEVSGWALDKIKVEGELLVEAPDAEAAELVFQMTKLEALPLGDGGVEIAVFYDRGVSLREKQLRALYEGQNVQMKIHVYAPYQLPLSVLGAEDAIHVTDWRGDLQVRTTSGPIFASNVKGERVSLVSQSGDVTLTSWQSKKTSLVSTRGRIEMRGGVSQELFAETGVGEQIYGVDLSGDAVLSSESAPIRVRGLKGKASFETESGEVSLSDVLGMASGRTGSGRVRVQFLETSRDFEAAIESTSGSIEVELPESFQAMVDLKTVSGAVELAFPLSPLASSTFYGPQPLNFRKGQIGSPGSRSLRARTVSGDVQITKRDARS